MLDLVVDGHHTCTRGAARKREENLFDDDDATLAVTTAAVVFPPSPLKDSAERDFKTSAKAPSPLLIFCLQPQRQSADIYLLSTLTDALSFPSAEDRNEIEKFLS